MKNHAHTIVRHYKKNIYAHKYSDWRKFLFEHKEKTINVVFCMFGVKDFAVLWPENRAREKLCRQIQEKARSLIK